MIARLMGDTEKVVIDVYNHVMEEKEDVQTVLEDTVDILRTKCGQTYFYADKIGQICPHKNGYFHLTSDKQKTSEPLILQHF